MLQIILLIVLLLDPAAASADMGYCGPNTAMSQRMNYTSDLS
jgi:hypothetical protein